MNLILQNEKLAVTINKVGAQLCSVRDATGSEYIWQADPEIWARHAPLLFPVIGRLQGGTYTINGHTYTIPSHGFARDSLFCVTEQTEDRVVLVLTDNETTKAVYPFSFVLTVTYVLVGNQLVKSCCVKNTGTDTMFFELGGHDGFCIPAGARMDDYAIVLDGVDAIVPYGMDATYMTTPKGNKIPLAQGRIPLKPSVYGLDTIILDAPDSHRAKLVDGEGNPRIILEFPDFDYLGLWTMDKLFDTNYVCIEPWSTLPDATFVGRGLNQKLGIRELAPQQATTLTYTTTYQSF